MGEKKKKKKLPIILGIVAIIIVIAAVAGGSGGAKKVGDSTASGSDTGNVSGSTTNKGTEQSKFAVGDVVDLNGVQVTLTKVTEWEGSQYNRPQDGNVYLQCEFEISNQSSSDITVSSMVSFEAYCDDYSINESFSALGTDNMNKSLDGTVAVGKKISGMIGYEVSADWKNLEITYSPSYWGNKSMTFEATH